MSWAGLTVCVCMIVAGCVDGVLVWRFGVDGSISRWIQNLGFCGHPVIILLIGFLLGHWFGYMPPKPISEQKVKE